MRNGKLTRGVMGIGLLAGTLTLGTTLVATANSGATVVKGHVSTYDVALTGTRQREIWPYVDGSRFTVTNVSTTQQPQYRPLYWFGLGSSTLFQAGLSMAAAPVFSGGNKTVTITLKTGAQAYHWYDANTHASSLVTNKNIEFWFNLAKADPTGYGGYTPGYGIPDQIASTQLVGTTKFVIHLKSAVNPQWFLYNALATVTPLPSQWDTSSLSAPGAHMQGCENLAFTAVALHAGPCDNVYQAFSDDTNNYAADNNLNVWKVYDGPYMMTHYNYASDATYSVTFQPNPGYTGPVHAHVNVQFHFFTDLSSEITALEAGNILDVGAASPDLVTAAPHPGQAGTNKDALIAAHYHARSAAFWGFDYAYINFGGHSVHNALVKQQYIRAALIQAVNQNAIIHSSSIYNGYAVGSCSALPKLNDPFSAGVPCPYPYSVTKAKALLTSHGWTIGHPAATCTKSAGCGAGIPHGTKLNLNFEYISTGSASPFDTEVATEKSAWAAVGINVTLNPTTEAAVSNDCLNDVPASSTYDICEYGGWVYSPGAYPSGEQLFLNGAVSNVGFVNNPTMNADIKKSITTSTTLKTYDSFVAAYVPVMFQTSALGVGELRTSVVGAQPINPISDFNPEYITAA
jgi:peptide/nickel transport system substrate-binding protein